MEQEGEGVEKEGEGEEEEEEPEEVTPKKKKSKRKHKSHLSLGKKKQKKRVDDVYTSESSSSQSSSDLSTTSSPVKSGKKTKPASKAAIPAPQSPTPDTATRSKTAAKTGTEPVATKSKSAIATQQPLAQQQPSAAVAKISGKQQLSTGKQQQSKSKARAKSGKKCTVGKRTNDLNWERMNEVTQGDRLKGLRDMTIPPPMDRLGEIGELIAKSVGARAVVQLLEAIVRIAVNLPAEVYKPIPPSPKRNLDNCEENAMRAYMPFFDKQNKKEKGFRAEMRREWSRLCKSGPMSDPTQIFLELAIFDEEIATMLQTVSRIEGFTTLCMIGRDALDLITLARVFSAYVDDNC